MKGEGNRKLGFNGHIVFCKMKKVLWVNGGVGNETMGMHLILLNFRLKKG